MIDVYVLALYVEPDIITNDKSFILAEIQMFMY